MQRVRPLARRVTKFMEQPPTMRGAASVIVLATAIVVVGAGVLIRFVDHQEYSNVWVGMWWAVQTVTTVGYGDVTPKRITGRLVGGAVMLEGVAFIAILTAVITSTFVARATRITDVGHEQQELSDREMIERRFDELEAKLDRLVAEQGPG
ncbi:MAG TPA: potassium channel family protein [Gaiellaceae bacterium]|nr:potassium channel family protein [Gaiellaceae bacterium]